MQRNYVVHGIVKDNADSEGQSIEDFIVKAKKVAEIGRQLARRVSAWQQKHKRYTVGENKVK
ncbi:hypothetical protein [Synechococcus sp. H55.10]|uniref:hypothetical protein n=1 Tax=Synechococcus sp. H55.10 TaxID=2964503 RepID=UPI0039C651C2